MSGKVEELAREIVTLSDDDWKELLTRVREEREEREEMLAWLRLAASSAEKDWDNELDAAYDRL
jgi:hypothetical protein